MGSQTLLRSVVGFVIYVLLQSLFGDTLVLWGYGFCFFYISILLTRPFEMGRMTYMAYALALGFAIDVFQDTIGIHAASCVLMAYLRENVKRFNNPSGGYEPGMAPNITSMGYQWFIGYSFYMVLIHHTLFFVLEASNWELFPYTLAKIVCSTAYTMIALLIIQGLLAPRKRRRR